MNNSRFDQAINVFWCGRRVIAPIELKAHYDLSGFAELKNVWAGPYFVIPKQPESRGLVVFVVCDVQVVCSRLKNEVLTSTLGFDFGFHHLTGVKGCLERRQTCELADGRVTAEPDCDPSPHPSPAGHFPHTLKRRTGDKRRTTWAHRAGREELNRCLVLWIPSMSAASPSSSPSSSSS